MEILGQRPVWSMSGGEMVSSLDAAYAEIARLEAFALHLIAGLDTTGHAQDVGAGTTARFLAFRYRIDATKARRDVNLANSLAKYPAVAAALPDPDPYSAETTTDTDTAAEDGAGMGVLLHPAQAEAIVSVLDKVPATVPAEDVWVAERAMVELGRTHCPLDLRKAGVQIRNRLDTDGPEPDEQKAYDRESLKLKRAENGVAFTGYLANENAELLRTLIHAHAKPRKTIDGALDPRSSDKRQADALTTILTTAGTTAAGTTNTPGAMADAGAGCTDAGAGSGAGAGTGADAGLGAGGGAGYAGGFSPGHGSRPQITVTIDFNDLKAATADKIGHLIYGDGLSAATIRRLACDAQILPIVLGSHSQPLDVGTTVRLATGPIRKALVARDKGCVCCGAPPVYCDAHHVKSWIDGGETKTTNLVLLCKRCHRDLHAGHWDINITHGVVHVARPTWATPAPVPRTRYRPPTTTPHPRGSTTLGSTTPDSAALGTARSGAPTRAWPRDTDPPWIRDEDTARLSPWGEGSGDGPRDAPIKPVGKARAGTGLDVWGDPVNSEPTIDRRMKPAMNTTGVFDPWGDVVPESADWHSPAGDDPGSSRRISDPWADRASESADGRDPAGDDPGPSRPSSVPGADSNEPQDTITAA